MDLEGMEENICFSGGAKGADKLFGELATKAGHKVIHYGFQGMFSPCPKEQVITLSAFYLGAADKHLTKANETLGRKFPTRSEYVNNLLRRNYYQIDITQRVYSSTPFDENMVPIGGTSWAIVMAINRGVKELHNFDWSKNRWFTYDADYFGPCKWMTRDAWTIPRPCGRYTGIGSSELPENGRKAIEQLYDGVTHAVRAK